MVYKSVKLKVSNTFQSSPNSLVLLIASYLRFTIGVADVDELKRTFLLLCLRRGSHAPRVDTAPNGAICLDAQRFHAWCPLHPRAQLQSVEFGYTLVSSGHLWVLLRTCRSPVIVELGIILRLCILSVFHWSFPSMETIDGRLMTV